MMMMMMMMMLMMLMMMMMMLVMSYYGRFVLHYPHAKSPSRRAWEGAAWTKESHHSKKV